MKRTLLLALVLAGCGSTNMGPHVAADGTPLIDGFDPTPPTTGQIQFVTPSLGTIHPGTDVTFCTYLDYNASQDWDVTTYLGFQSKGGHHTILYSVPHPQKPNSHVCTDQDMLGVRYVGGGGTDATIAASKIPDGIAFRIGNGSQIMLLSHWINATASDVEAQAAYNVTVQNPSPSVSPGDLFTVVDTQFSLPVGPGSAHTQCTLKNDLQFFLIGGHAHEHATNISITHHDAVAGSDAMIYDQKWDPSKIFDTPLDQYMKAAPLTMKAGDTFVVDCQYQNNTSTAIAFPTEMCVGFGYYFPATAEIDCVDGSWPTN
jgi:hypothetical protein